MIDDPSNAKQRLIVFRVEKCSPTGFLKPIPYVDLVPLLSDENALKEAILKSVKTGPILSLTTSSVARKGSIANDAEIDRVIQFLQNEDEQNFDKAIVYIFLGLFALAGVLIAFEPLVNLWNWMFGTSYYAIFDSGTVFFLLILASALFAGVGIWQVRETARVIENSDLSREQRLCSSLT